MDASSGYAQIEMDKNYNDKSTLVAHNGLLKYAKVPFSFKNAPAMFQRAMDAIMATVKWHHILVYIDNIIIFSESPGEHLRHIEEILIY